jgi:hypothetical protein
VKYMTGTLKVEYVAEEPVPADIVSAANQNLEQGRAKWAAKYAAAGMPEPTETLQMAAAIVRFKNGTFTMKGHLFATVDCTSSQVHANPRMAAWVTNTCTANVRYVYAPEAQYQAVIALMNPRTTGALEIPRWVKAWTDFNNGQTQQNLKTIQAWGQNGVAQIKANAAQFEESQRMRQHNYEQFQATMQHGFESFMNHQAQVAAANSKMTSDWVDFALDRQTVRDPNTGQVSKVSAWYSYTWVDNTGKVSYQTNESNADPNGTWPGTWTRQQQVHGDGTQK